MLVNYFRQNQPVVLFALLPVVLLLWPGGGPPPAGTLALEPSGMPLYRAFVGLCPPGSWTLHGLGLCLVIGVALQLNYTMNASELFARRNFLPALLLPLLLALFTRGSAPEPALVGMPFVLWAVRRLWASQSDHRVIGPLFDAGLLIGLASLCYLPYVFLVVVFWSSISVMRPFHWREYLMPLLGAGVVLGLTWSMAHLWHVWPWEPVSSFMKPLQAIQLLPAPHWFWRILLLLVALAFLVATVPVFAAGYARGIMREKNTRASFLAFSFAFGLLASFSWLLRETIPPVLIALPFAVLFSWPLLQAKRTAWAELGVLALLLLGLWARWA